MLGFVFVLSKIDIIFVWFFIKYWKGLNYLKWNMFGGMNWLIFEISNGSIGIFVNIVNI